ncbi:MAG: hypothetical protein CO105_10300 [Comamonadaceae bacterium CG_4_9_14_3_um_filter_60_33]|nr:MAG: hypothetical protein COZ09_12615 [Comamonadaceae bacterium CG_4_10_14_3_um_filter_60_42]PJB42793.1 MAG: hypothetical protein CO105_10300 [Comamonadaceae bacterium CG_4_9_14_3_um_filter_60_33]
MCDDCETLIQAPVPAQIIDKGIFNRHRRHRAQQLPRFENIHLQIAAPTLHRIALAQQSLGANIAGAAHNKNPCLSG